MLANEQGCSSWVHPSSPAACSAHLGVPSTSLCLLLSKVKVAQGCCGVVVCFLSDRQSSVPCSSAVLHGWGTTAAKQLSLPNRRGARAGQCRTSMHVLVACRVPGEERDQCFAWGKHALPAGQFSKTDGPPGDGAHLGALELLPPAFRPTCPSGVASTWPEGCSSGHRSLDVSARREGNCCQKLCHL